MMKYIYIILALAGLFSCKQEISQFEKQDLENKVKIDSLKKIIKYNTSYLEQIPIYEEILTIDNNDLSAYGNLGIINYELGYFQNAIIYESKAIEISKNQGSTFNQALHLLIRGKSKFELYDYRGCIDDLRRAEQLDLNSVDIYIYQGLSHLNLNQIDQACKYLSIAGEKGYTKAYHLISENCN